MDDAARSALAAQHLDLVRRIATIVHKRVAGHVDHDELVALGNLGLTEAAQRFNPDGGASFRTFAWYRIQGAILDGCRRNANLPRRVWSRLTALGATASYLEAAHERATAARDQATAATTGDRLREVQAALGAIRTMYVVSLDSAPAQNIATEEPSAPERLVERDRGRALAAAIAKLPEKERVLVEAHYVHGKTLLDAGAAIGLSKSWASRLHARAIDRLRELMAEPDAPPAPP